MPDGTVQNVAKMVHIAQNINSYEQDYYTPSNDGFKVFRTPFGNVGIVICSSAISICRRCRKSAGIRTICRSADRICTSYKPKKSLPIINREGFLYHLIITDTPH